LVGSCVRSAVIQQYNAHSWLIVTRSDGGDLNPWPSDSDLSDLTSIDEPSHLEQADPVFEGHVSVSTLLVFWRVSGESGGVELGVMGVLSSMPALITLFGRLWLTASFRPTYSTCFTPIES